MNRIIIKTLPYRPRGVGVITSVSHAEGRRFDSGRGHFSSNKFEFQLHQNRNKLLGKMMMNSNVYYWV